MAARARQPFDMPGLFASERLNGSTFAEDDMFAPAPRYTLAGETTGRHVTDPNAHETRKRSRPASTFTPSQTNSASSWGENSQASSRITDITSPPPLANERYQLAGGMERPQTATYNGNYDDYFQLEKQRGLWLAVTGTPSGFRNHLSSDILPPTSTASKPWMINQIMKVVGGVAGSVAQFCSLPFRGFKAGGGQAYSFGADGEIASTDRGDRFVDYTAAVTPIRNLVPGNFPEENYGVLSIESLESERPRMSKRARTGENWVMVDQEGQMDSRPTTPRLSERRVPAHARSPSQIPRPVSSASRAQTTPKRPSLIPVSRRSAIDRNSLHGTSGSAPRSYSRQSYGSPAMFKDSTKKSPLPPESQRLLNKMRREELEDEARMRRMSSQMSAMLREAQEALGSKVEIDEDYMKDDGLSVNTEGYAGQFPYGH